ncbi:unnamed protein product [Vitrella brassicaformis CCMP3155]|uniref:Uncharacterized protein n=1 Tax=Vitrella brassicaformis (strain CCMP3155) TaxID=1169540 RepID=A0A0G4EFK0_VITBC|nr:unnamed protein product [Vitrella brassicaformis CCMP3155]|eukprot:CEL94781.1 unnamed protein product [Vitrella brassicaformis CCMP3155]
MQLRPIDEGEEGEELQPIDEGEEVPKDALHCPFSLVLLPGRGIHVQCGCWRSWGKWRCWGYWRWSIGTQATPSVDSQRRSKVQATHRGRGYGRSRGHSSIALGDGSGGVGGGRGTSGQPPRQGISPHPDRLFPASPGPSIKNDSSYLRLKLPEDVRKLTEFAEQECDRKLQKKIARLENDVLFSTTTAFNLPDAPEEDIQEYVPTQHIQSDEQGAKAKAIFAIKNYSQVCRMEIENKRLTAMKLSNPVGSPLSTPGSPFTGLDPLQLNDVVVKFEKSHALILDAVEKVSDLIARAKKAKSIIAAAHPTAFTFGMNLLDLPAYWNGRSGPVNEGGTTSLSLCGGRHTAESPHVAEFTTLHRSSRASLLQRHPHPQPQPPPPPRRTAPPLTEAPLDHRSPTQHSPHHSHKHR